MEENLEKEQKKILIVDDEQAIIDEYVKKYPSIIKSIVKENGGYGSVLQLAFNKSDADYILVCDPDDYLADDALSTLISYQKKDDVDLVVGAGRMIKGKDEILLRHSNISEGEKYNARDFTIKSIKHSEWNSYACLSLYDREFLLKNDLFFREGIIFEDMQIFLKSPLNYLQKQPY